MSEFQTQETVQTDRGVAMATTRTSRFSPGQILGMLAGIVLSIIGIVAIAKGGFDGSLNTPVVQVLGIGHSTIVGLAELGAGLLMILGSASRSTVGVTGFVGVLLIVAGIIAAASGAKLKQDVGFETDTGWLLLGFGVVGLVAALLPSFARTERHVTATADHRVVAPPADPRLVPPADPRIAQ
jgi:uncharacterized membrane protein HdeD (DUF308 family)